MIAKLLVRTALWIAALAALIFVSAGTIAWPAGWIFLAIMGGTSVANGLWLARNDPGLLEERLAPVLQPDQERWDKLLILAALGFWILWLGFVALDGGRLHLSPVPTVLQGAGALIIIAGMALVFFTFRENSYAAPVVKIQTARGHRVVTRGPYSYVRHPMYAGALLIFIGTPLLLDSWIGLALAPAMIALLALRAVREERLLAERLQGYSDYAARVRYRLVPGLW